jgi:hypothetical protein
VIEYGNTLSGLKIAVSGAHSTGKSRFISTVANALKVKGISHSIVSDLAGKCPLPILRDHTVESTLWIAARGIAEEIEAAHRSAVVLVDRPVLDAWAYLLAAVPAIEDSQTIKILALRDLIVSWLPTYSRIYQTEVDQSIPIDDNKGRDLDPAYRLAIGRQMELASRTFGVGPKLLTSANSLREAELLVSEISSGDFVELRK